MESKPKKYIFVNGVMMLNPALNTGSSPAVGAPPPPPPVHTQSSLPPPLNVEMEISNPINDTVVKPIPSGVGILVPAWFAQVEAVPVPKEWSICLLSFGVFFKLQNHSL